MGERKPDLTHSPRLLRNEQVQQHRAEQADKAEAEELFVERVLEPDPELCAALEKIAERREANGPPATEPEITALKARVCALVANGGAPEFPQKWWDNIATELRKAPRGAALRARTVPATPEEQPAIEPPPKRKRRRGAEPDFLSRDKVKRVLELSRNGNLSQERVAELAGVSRKAVRRIRRLERKRALDLGPQGGVRLAGNPGDFRPAHKTVSLRALERALGLDALD